MGRNFSDNWPPREICDDQTARERFAVKALVNAVHDKDTVFYIKEKNPQTMDEVCALYERYKVLTGNSVSYRPATVKGVRPTEQTPENSPNDNVLDKLTKQAEIHSQQLSQLIGTVQKLLQQPRQQPPPPATQPPFPPRHPASAHHPARADAPRKPCPKCRQTGHWDCPNPETCYACRQPGHRRSECQAHLNANGPTSAPHVGPTVSLPY